MAEAPTFESVWRMFQENAEQLREMARKSEREYAELRKQSEETDRRFRETDRQFKETDRQFKETDRRLQEVTRQLGSHGNRLGEFVQEMVRPAVVGLFKRRNLPVHQVMPNIVAYDDHGQFVMEIDLLVINATTAIAVECKSKLTVEDVQEHLDRMELFKQCFPQYQGYTLLGAVAGMVLPEEVGRYAYRRGLYVLAQSGEGVVLLNNETFQPRQW